MYNMKKMEDLLDEFKNILTHQNKVSNEIITFIESLPYEILRPVLLRPIKDLELTIRSENCLRFLKIYFIGDLIQLSATDLLKTPNFGQKSFAEIKLALSKLSLSLGTILENWPPESLKVRYEQLRATHKLKIRSA